MQSAANAAVFAFVVTNMFSVGLGLSLSQILTPFRSVRLVFSSLVANFIVAPLFAYAIARSLNLNQAMVIAILLLGTAAGAPILPKLAEFARGDLGYSVGLMVMLMTATVAYMPTVVPLLVPGVHVGRWAVARPLVAVLLIPLIIGLFLRARSARLAARLHPYFRWISTVLLITALTLVTVANYDELIAIDYAHLIGAAALLFLVCFVTGFVLAGPTTGTRKVLAFGTAQRDLSAALLVAIENFPKREIVVILTVFALLGAFVQIPLAIALGRRGPDACEHA